jgi:nucleoside-diphosphate-sugar epimerase/glycosyltransferase involved in cell wall biosynthesis
MSIKQHILALKGPILVTGASGFIGATLFKMLFKQRQDVFAIVRQEKGWRLADIDNEHILIADLNDYTAVKNLIDSTKPKTIFDCVAYGAYSFEEDSSLIYKTNFQSVLNIVSHSVQHSIAAYIHAGSSSEYGLNCAAPLETDRCEPNSHYAVSKVAAETYLRYMGKYHQFPSVSLRLYSIYGPLEDSSRLIPNILRHALVGSMPPLVERKTSRDFLYVDDACFAFIMAATKIQPDIYGESFNIGTGVKTTIEELAEIVRAEFKVSEKPQFGKMEARAWDLQEWYANADKAKNILGWVPKFNLYDGLRETYEWLSRLTDEEFIHGTKKNVVNKKRSLTAIVACYKDEQAIPFMYRRLTDVFKKIGIDYEIIFVNDCSPDNTAYVIEHLSATDSRIIGISHSRNFGSQMAFRSGMELSTKEGVVLLDGDLQDPPELIEKFYEQWELGSDVVYGRRVQRDMPWFWGLCYKLFYRIFAAFSYIKIPLDAGDFSLIDRKVVGWMLGCPERDLFMRGIRAYVGFKQTGVDYVRPERMFGTSTNNFIKNINWAKKGIFSFSDTPLNILTIIGFILLLCSVLIAISVSVLKVFYPEVAPKGITTLLVTILMFGSLNLFAISLVGEYVAKIMSEVKNRPRLIRSSLIRNGKTTELSPGINPYNNSLN